MKLPVALETTQVFVEFRSDSFHARSGDAGIDLPVERTADGRLTPTSVGQITAALQGLPGRKSWLSRVRFHVAIGSRGLILRPISLPTASPTEVPRLLQLQIEGEFPLPPEALAWGWRPLPASAAAGTSGRQEVLVAAVKKEVVEDHAAALQPVSADFVFTPAALARAALVPAPAFALLDLGSSQSELTLQEAGGAPSVRLLSWGENRLLDCLASRSGQSRDQAVEGLAILKAGTAAAVTPGYDDALSEAVGQLFLSLPAAAFQLPLWISGPPGLAPLVARLLATRWGTGQPPQVLAVTSGPGQTAATLGIAQALAARNDSLVVLGVKPAEVPDRMVPRLPRRPLLIAAALLAAVLAFPYVEAFVFKPQLARRLASLKSNATQLATIDRELSFLRYLEQNQAPHLDATFVIAQAAPSGAQIENLTINRQGEVAITGFLRDLAQVGDFRLKLVNSGFFSTVVVEDQSPTPDRQRISFRINARWKDIADREALTLGPPLPEPGAGKSTATNVAPGAPARPTLPPSASPAPAPGPGKP